MKEVLLDRSFFNCTYGISCVENLLLYILKSNNIAYQYLFFDSFISIYDIIYDFLYKGNSFENFTPIKRIQDLAEQEQIIGIELLNTSSIPAELDNKYCCVMVQPDFIWDNYKTKLLRDDHYVLLHPCDNHNYYYINDTPRDIKKVSSDNINSYYAGRAILFDIKTDISKDKQKDYLRRLICKINETILKAADLPSDILLTRDIIGILRILRKRLVYMVSEYINTEYWQTYLNELDGLYAKIEYMRLRNKYNIETINSIWSKVVVDDIENIKKTVALLNDIVK